MTAPRVGDVVKDPGALREGWTVRHVLDLVEREPRVIGQRHSGGGWTYIGSDGLPKAGRFMHDQGIREHGVEILALPECTAPSDEIRVGDRFQHVKGSVFAVDRPHPIAPGAWIGFFNGDMAVPYTFSTATLLGGQYRRIPRLDAAPPPEVAKERLADFVPQTLTMGIPRMGKAAAIEAMKPRCAPNCTPAAPCRTVDVCPVFVEEKIDREWSHAERWPGREPAPRPRFTGPAPMTTGLGGIACPLHHVKVPR